MVITSAHESGGEDQAVRAGYAAITFKGLCRQRQAIALKNPSMSVMAIFRHFISKCSDTVQQTLECHDSIGKSVPFASSDTFPPENSRGDHGIFWKIPISPLIPAVGHSVYSSGEMEAS